MIINYSDQEVIKGKKSIFLANNLYNEQVSEILPLEERKMIKKLRK